jgi:hypothetical protein
MAHTVSNPSIPDPELVHGSLITLRRKCGKSSCRCVDGEVHETPALSFSVEGRTKIVTLRAGELEPVRGAVEAYQQARAELDAAAAGFEQVRAWLDERRARNTGR